MPKSKTTPKTTPKTKLLDSHDAAAYIGCSVTSLKLGRCTGTLFQVPAPAYLKMGKTVRYKLSTLDAWMDQFEERQSTAQ